MRTQVSLPFEQWPLVDQKAWHSVFEEADLGDIAGAGAHLAPATQKLHRRAWGRWLFWLQGEDVLGTMPACRLLTRDRVRSFWISVNHLSANTQAMIFETLDQCARWMAPDQDWGWIKPIRARIRREMHRRRDKRSRLVHVRELQAVGTALMAQARARAEVIPVRHLTQFRDGLMIALLSACPVRLGNFTSIRLDQHLLRKHDRYWLRFEEAEVKSRRELAMPVPLGLNDAIEHYCAVIRPALLGGRQEQALWITKVGDPMPYWSIEKQIKAQTRKALGHPINPHLFRDCVATSIALEDPAGVRTAQDVLGHGSFRTTEQHYIHADQIKAVTDYQRARRTRAHNRRIQKDPP